MSDSQHLRGSASCAPNLAWSLRDLPAMRLGQLPSVHPLLCLSRGGVVLRVAVSADEGIARSQAPQKLFRFLIHVYRTESERAE